MEWGGEGKNHFSLFEDSDGQREPESRPAVCPERVMEVVRYRPQALHQRQPGVERRESGKGNNRGARCGLAAGSQR